MPSRSPSCSVNLRDESTLFCICLGQFGVSQQTHNDFQGASGAYLPEAFAFKHHSERVC